MTGKYGLATAIFSLKSFAAAMLALYIAFSIGLERPYWAFLTSYIVAQPLAGAVLSKALFRVVGTFVGAAAAVAMVPALNTSPELLTLAIGSWLGLCVFVSLLDRTPRSYMFVLAGYSACLIALPSVETPGAIFTVASLRVQEITIGILCSSFVHGFVLPGSVTAFLLRRVGMILGDAERWSHDSLLLVPPPAIAAERQRLAQDVTELHQLSIHLPFETSRLAPRTRTVRALQDQLSLLLPLGAAIADRLAILRAEPGGIPAAFEALLADTRDWIAGSVGEREARHLGARELRARCVAMEPVMTPATGWRDMMQLSLAARLAALIGAHGDCRDLAEQMATHDRRPVSPRVPDLLEGRRNRELHRDVRAAARGAGGAFLTIVIGSALWIGSGWQDGATAVMLAGVFLSLFSASDDLVVPLKAFLIGTAIAAVLGAIYGYAILPRVDGFAMLAAAFAPPLLILGALMASPRYAGFALPTLLGLGSPALLANRYTDDFAPFINGAIAQLVGTWFAILMARLLASAGVEGAIRRTVRAGWLDIASRSNLMGPPDVRGWTNRMLDRIGLLAPRLARRGMVEGAPLYDALQDLRTGIAIGELRQVRLLVAPVDQAPLTTVLRDVGAHFRTLDPAAPAPASTALLVHIDAALRAFAGADDPAVRRDATLGLVSLRRNLFPDADDYRPAPIGLAA